MPAGPGVRVDTAIRAGDRVPPEYDNLIAKLMVHAGDREAAIARLARALDETEVAGIQTTLPFHRFVARDPSFHAADLSTSWVDEHWDGPAEQARAAKAAQLAAGLAGIREAAFASPIGGNPPAPRPGGPDPTGDGRWRRSATEAAIDRWPR